MSQLPGGGDSTCSIGVSAHVLFFATATGLVTPVACMMRFGELRLTCYPSTSRLLKEGHLIAC
jgi:hypothetical protein